MGLGIPMNIRLASGRSLETPRSKILLMVTESHLPRCTLVSSSIATTCDERCPPESLRKVTHLIPLELFVGVFSLLLE